MAGKPTAAEVQAVIRLYIFDMGGVVSLGTDLSAQIADRLGLAGADIHEMAREDFDALVRGAITVAEFWERFSRRIGHSVEEDLWTTFFEPTPNPPVVELVRELKSRARVVVGTNTITPHYQIHQDNGDYAIFDTVYASQLIGLAKPDPAFYRHILENEGCRPEQAVFVDDMEANVEAARGLGIHALLFRDAGLLRRQLAQLEKAAHP
jgi:HAD superfamily hydrolase (TIGR01509 family)